MPLGSAVAGLTDCWTQARANTPKPVWNPDVPQAIDFFASWQKVPNNQFYDNAFKVEWELFIRHLFEDTPLCGAVPLGGWPRMFAFLKHWRDRRGQARRRCVDGEVLELNLSSRRLGKDFLRLLLKYIHRADVWDWTVANARDAELGETFIRGHAVHNHNIHR